MSVLLALFDFQCGTYVALIFPNDTRHREINFQSRSTFMDCRYAFVTEEDLDRIAVDDPVPVFIEND